MFGLKAKEFHDEQLGDFRKSGGYWTTTLALPPCGTFRLALSGTRTSPADVGLNLARQLPNRFNTLIPDIQRGLFEHYFPYKEAVVAGEETGSPYPDIAEPEAVWPHVTATHVLIKPHRGVWIVEIGFRVAWDIEHTVGARFQDWNFVELNGSV